MNAHLQLLEDFRIFPEKKHHHDLYESTNYVHDS